MAGSAPARKRASADRGRLTRRSTGSRPAVRLGRPLAAVLCAVLAAGCGTSATPRPAGRATPVAAPAGPAPTTLAGYYRQKLRWVACDKVFRCARLLVPFDYSRPAWRRFSLPVIELPASHPAERIGALLV